LGTGCSEVLAQNPHRTFLDLRSWQLEFLELDPRSEVLPNCN
jgi:hypothetical protein